MKVFLSLAALLGVAVAGDSYAAPHAHAGHAGHAGAYGHPHGYGASLGYGHHRVFGFPGSDPRCHEEGDIVMDPDNRCQVYTCVEKKKQHGYDDKHVYKYFDVELVKCPTVKVPAHIQHPHHAHAVKDDKHAAPAGYGFGHHQGYSHQGYGHGYGYKLHEVDIQTAVNKYNHAHYLATHVKGEAKAVCGDYAYKPDKECTDVQKH